MEYGGILGAFIFSIVCLIYLSYSDIKTFNVKGDGIPAILTTIFILFMLLFQPNNIIQGVVGFLLGMILVDIDFFGGVPDWKVIVACSLFFHNIPVVILFGVIVLGIGLIYKKIFARFSNHKLIPFIPAIALAYFLTIGGLYFGII
jgi:hypothetical protein